MSGVQTEFIFKGSIDEVFSAITQYELYPKHIPFVQAIAVLPAKAKGAACSVRYDLNLIKKFYYILNMHHEEPHLVRWDLQESDILSRSEGSWELSKDGAKKTKAIYTVDVEPKLMVPKLLVNKLTKSALPQTLEGFQSLVTEISSAGKKKRS